jgi:hypothetical protein
MRLRAIQVEAANNVFIGGFPLLVL